MKKTFILLTTLSLIHFGFSQTKDNGQPISSTTFTAPSLEKGGSGVIGLYCGNNLSTPVVSTNGNQGVMFEVHALNTVVVTALSINLANNYSGDVTVYHRTGSFTSFEGSAVGWTNLGTINMTNPGTVQLMPLALDTEIPSGTIASFYLHGTNGDSFDYSDGTALGATLASDANIDVKQGHGVTDIFGTLFTPRNFEGIVHYCLPQSIICDTAFTDLNDVNGNSGIFFDVTAGANPINIEQLYGDFTYFGPQEFNLKLYSRPGTHVGFENSLVGWTLHADNNLALPSGNNIPRALTSGLTVQVPAGTTRAFYIFTDANNIDYNNDPDPLGTPTYSDGNIIIKTGGGNTTLFGGVSNPQRNFNGIIDYCIANVGIDDLSASELQMFPNPANDKLTLSLVNSQISKIVITDLLGQTCFSQDNNSSKNETSIDLGNLKSGAYFVSVYGSNSQVHSMKLIKQ